MIRISITAAAFEAIAATLQLGSVGYERGPDDTGELHIWLEPSIVNNKLRYLRGTARAFPTSSSG